MEQRNTSFLPKIFGLWDIKAELELIYNGYKDPESFMERKSLLPRGLLFFGEPGFGKTLLIREYSKLFACPVYEIEGNSSEVEREILDVYEKAAKEPMAIVVIDELDKLVQDDRKLARVIQSQLDGFRERPNVLTLASANERETIPEPLLREGRFDRQFDVELRGKGETEEVLRNFLTMTGVVLDEDDIPELVDEFARKAPTHIRAAISGALLRKGKSCTAEDIMDSSYFVSHGLMPKKEDLCVERRTAIHEAGHAAFLHFFARSITYGRIYFTLSGGFTTLREEKVGLFTVESVDERIQCDLAGLVSEKLILGRCDFGSSHDLDDAHHNAYCLVNMEAVNGVESHCDISGFFHPMEKLSQEKARGFEIASQRYVKRQYRIVRRKMRRIKKDILRLSAFLMENKKASKQDIARILGPVA